MNFKGQILLQLLNLKTTNQITQKLSNIYINYKPKPKCITAVAF